MFFRRPKVTSSGQPLTKVATFQAALRKFAESRSPDQAIAIHIGCEQDSVRVNVPGMDRVRHGAGPGVHLDSRELRVVLALCAQAVGRRYAGASLRQLTQAVKIAGGAKILREQGTRTGFVRVSSIRGDES